MKTRIASYGFIENEDFIVCSPKRGSKGSGGHNLLEQHITLDMAKERAMVELNEKGREACRYFIDCEKQLKEDKPKESPQSKALPRPRIKVDD